MSPSSSTLETMRPQEGDVSVLHHLTLCCCLLFFGCFQSVPYFAYLSVMHLRGTFFLEWTIVAWLSSFGMYFRCSN